MAFSASRFLRFILSLQTFIFVSKYNIDVRIGRLIFLIFSSLMSNSNCFSKSVIYPLSYIQSIKIIGESIYRSTIIVCCGSRNVSILFSKYLYKLFMMCSCVAKGVRCNSLRGLNCLYLQNNSTGSCSITYLDSFVLI